MQVGHICVLTSMRKERGKICFQSSGMIKKLFAEPLLFFYLRPSNFSFIAAMHRAEYHVIKGPWPSAYCVQLMLILILWRKTW